MTGWSYGKYVSSINRQNIIAAELYPFYSTGRSYSILRPCASSILFCQNAIQSLAELVMAGWGHGEYVSPIKQLYITQSTCRLDNTNAKALLCYIYRHSAWSIKLEIVMLWGEKCQLTVMVTTDAEIYKGPMQRNTGGRSYDWRSHLKEERWLPTAFGIAAGRAVFSLFCLVSWDYGFLKKLVPLTYFV